MMDAALVISDAQAITTTANGTNILKLSATSGVNKGKGTPLYLHVRVNTTFVATAAGTLSVGVYTADTSATATLCALPISLAKGTLVKGYDIINMPLPAAPPLAQFIKCVYTQGTSVFTAGKIDAWIDMDDGTKN
jgi:hypothetical protein